MAISFGSFEQIQNATNQQHSKKFVHHSQYWISVYMKILLSWCSEANCVMLKYPICGHQEVHRPTPKNVQFDWLSACWIRHFNPELKHNICTKKHHIQTDSANILLHYEHTVSPQCSSVVCWFSNPKLNGHVSIFFWQEEKVVATLHAWLHKAFLPAARRVDNLFLVRNKLLASIRKIRMFSHPRIPG